MQLSGGGYREPNEQEKMELLALFGDDPIIVIDEYFLITQEWLGRLNARLRLIIGKGFRDLRVLLVGDPFQLPPIGGSPLYCDYATSTDAELQTLAQDGRNQFGHCRHFLLTIIMRSGDDGEHCRNIHRLCAPNVTRPMTIAILNSIADITRNELRTRSDWAAATVLSPRKLEALAFGWHIAHHTSRSKNKVNPYPLQCCFND
jgi:hypothetical protein